MNRFAPVKLLIVLNSLVAIILILMPFHAFLTVWLSSLVGHYTLLRLWKEVLLVSVVLGALYLYARDNKLRRQIAGLRLTQLIAAYLLLLLVCSLIPLVRHDVGAKAVWYGLLVDSRYLIFFLAVLAISASSGWLSANWRKLLFIPAVLVAAFAILQYLVLPNDFLRHFGYGDSTISPYETINHNLQHIRVASTLRGANPLGAYLIVPISMLSASLFKQKSNRRDKLMLGAGLLLASAFSFSRSAWIGAFLAVAIAAWLSFRSFRIRKLIGWWLAGALILGCVLVFALRNNLSFENAVFHTDRQSTIAVSSNQGHSAAFKSAAKDVLHHPLGSGVGSAGPQSFYNGHKEKIAENYFLQIGQEAGVLGMILFIAICLAFGKLLYDNRNQPLALALLAAFIGLCFVNLLSHAWEDDTLAYVYWGLAGVALGPILTDKAKAKNGQKIKKP